MEVDFEKICRTCMSVTEKLISINEVELQRKLSECCNLQIEVDDDLPGKICLSCTAEVERTISFREKCLRSESHLSQLLRQRRKERDPEKVEIPYVCSIEDSSSSLDSNQISRFVCDSCQDTFETKSSLKRHISRSHSLQLEYFCDFCAKKLVRKDQLSRHLKEHFVDTVINDKSMQFETHDPKYTEPNALGLFQCHVCKLMLKTRRNLLRHHQTHLGIKFKCKLCEKHYNRKYRVTEHMRVAHGIEMTGDPEVIRRVPDNKGETSCDKCGKTFKNKYKLRDHMTVIHSDTRPFLCGQCGQSFKTKSTFQYHETRYHIQIKSFKCEQCPKAYYSNKELICHIRSHTGEKPFVCADCGASYAHSDSLNTHRRLHTGVRPYKCEFCDKTFIKGERLKIHRRIHTGERPFACGICDQRFTQKYDMIKHEKRHPEYQSGTMDVTEESFIL